MQRRRQPASLADHRAGSARGSGRHKMPAGGQEPVVTAEVPNCGGTGQQMCAGCWQYRTGAKGQSPAKAPACAGKNRDCAPAKRGYVPLAPSGPILPPRDCLQAPATPHRGRCGSRKGVDQRGRRLSFFGRAPSLLSAHDIAEAKGAIEGLCTVAAAGMAPLSGTARSTWEPSTALSNPAEAAAVTTPLSAIFRRTTSAERQDPCLALLSRSGCP